jgi:hypothetical protein
MSRWNPTVAFSAGMTLAVSGVLVIPSLVGSLGWFDQVSGTISLATIALPVLVGGAIAGSSLAHGWRGIAGFAVAFPVGVALPTLTVFSLDAMSGREPLLQVLLLFLGIFALSFGAIGGIGAAFLGNPWRSVLRVVWSFAGSGIVGGAALTATVFLTSRQHPLTDSEAMTAIGILTAFLLPAVISGRSLERFLKSTESRFEPARQKNGQLTGHDQCRSSTRSV